MRPTLAGKCEKAGKNRTGHTWTLGEGYTGQDGAFAGLQLALCGDTQFRDRALLLDGQLRDPAVEARHEAMAPGARQQRGGAHSVCYVLCIRMQSRQVFSQLVHG